ncbi:MAG: single-stranded DNA-binding protein [Clostridia bacterium]|nr:single-stranded DNA-binding protein [Clostridia bacterium]
MSANNRICLSGNIVDEPSWRYSCYGRAYYSFSLQVKRLSSNVDILPVHMNQELRQPFIRPDSAAFVEGEIRTCNREVEGKKRLIIYVHARRLYAKEIESRNEVYLRGRLCKAPVKRFTPFGKEIADALIAVMRANGKFDYIPLILWGKNARRIIAVPVGSIIEIDGRMQSREYVKQYENGAAEKRIALEVSVLTLNQIT